MQHRRIIKRGPIVLATQEDGTMDPASATSQGLFLADTRFLSTFTLKLNDVAPVLMGSSEEILFETSFILTNPAFDDIPANDLGILQRNTIQEDVVKMSLLVVNWSLQDVEFTHLHRSRFYDTVRGARRQAFETWRSVRARSDQ